uniref:Retrovirus-related Pol polyprotein from transposon TNT 1-94 n=1 Tax=Tanacetum cinerariifolium TaxID=118510 RepID=A0A6L2NS08_TANCI|nr:retrovirus-related Pol polyprotein from transposon TNT 1-94 [Tanacetum cinerariifolium]
MNDVDPDTNYGNHMKNTRFTIETVTIEYEWKPPRCGLCKIFGHIHDQCPKKVSISTIVATSNKKGKSKSTNGGQFGGPSVKQYVRYEHKATTSAPKKGTTNMGNARSMLMTTITSTKKGNIATSNPYSALEDESDEYVENVYDESDNLFQSTKSGESSSSFMAVVEFRFRIDSKIFNKFSIIVVVVAAKLPILNPNKFDLWKMRIEQYFLVTYYSLWEVILNGDSPSPTRIVDGVVQIVAPTTAEQRLAKKNKLKARGTLLMALPDKHQLKFNIYKDAKSLMEAIEKRFEGNKETKKEDINLKFLRSLPLEWKTHTLIWRNKADLEEQSLDDLFNNLKIYEAEVKGSSTSSQNFLNMAFVSSNNTNSTTESVNVPPSVFSASTKAKFSTLPIVDSLKDDVIYSFFSSQSNSSQLDNKDLKKIDPDDLKEMDLNMMQLVVMIGVFKLKKNPLIMYLWLSPYQAHQVLRDKIMSQESNTRVTEKQENDRYKIGEGYHVVPPPYTGNFLPLKLDLVFTDDTNASESVANVINIESSEHKTSKDKEYVKKVKHNKQVENLKTNNQKSRGHKTNWKNKACFVCRNFNHLIKDCDYYERQLVQMPVWNSATRVNHQNLVRMNHPHLKRNVVPIAVLTRSRLVSLNAVRPVTTVVTQSTVKCTQPVQNVLHKTHSPGNPQQALQDKGVTDSGCSRHMTGNISFLSEFEKIDGGYVAFGGNSKGGKISRKGKIKTDTECVVLSFDYKLLDENYVLLRVLRENNMCNVDLKNVVLSGGLTCLFAKATLDESNLLHRRLGHINFKSMNKHVKGNLFCGMKGIKREFSVARTPQQNRVAKRKNRTLIEAARTMLADSLLPIPFWAEVVNMVCYVQNRVLVTKPYNKTPYELLPGRSPSIGFLRPFGCPVTILNTLDPLRKFDGKADEGFLVGYSINCKAFRVFNSRTRIVQETLHINFLENKPNVAGIRPKWLFDIDTLTMSINYQPVIARNQPNDNAGINENLDVGKVGKETVSAQEYKLLPFWSSAFQDLKNTVDNVADDAFEVKENENNGVRDLRAKFEEFSFNNTNKVNAVSKPVTAARPNPTNSTTSFNTACYSVDAVSLNFRIAKKSSFMDPFNYPDDLDMPELEDIVYSDDEEDVGAEVDLSNLETNIHVNPIPTTRVHKDLHVNQIIGLDTGRFTKGKRAIGKKWVFRNKKDERGIMIRNKARLVAHGHTQEEGIDYDEVYAPVARIEAIRLFLSYASFMGFMVIKALYGLHQAPRAWYETLANFLLENGFQRGKIDQTLFIKKQKGYIFLVQVYMDDIIFGSTNKELYKPLLKDLDGEDVEVYLYRSMIGSLMYLTSSRPDIMFVVCACTRFQVTPKVSHLHAVKRILRYLKGKPHLGLWYPRDSPFNLVASVSDYAGASLNRKSTTGGCQFLDMDLLEFSLVYLVVTSVFMMNRGVNTPRCDEDSIELKELMVFIVSICVLRKIELELLLIFEKLARMGYEKPPLKLTFYKAFFSTQWKFLIHTIVQCISAKRTAWNEFSSSMASAFICLATGRKFNFSKYIFGSMVRNVDSPSKFLMYPCFIQVVLDQQVDEMTTHNTRYKSPALTQKVFSNMRRVGKGFLGVETPLFASMLVQSQPQAEEGVEVPIPHAQPSTTSASSPTDLQDTTLITHDTSPQYQPTTPYASPLQDQPTTPHDSPMPLLTKLMETCATLSQQVVELEKDKDSQALEILQLKKRVKSSIDTVLDAEEDASKQGEIAAIDADEGITLVNVKTDEEEVAIDAESQERTEINAVSKEVSAVSTPKLVSTTEPTVFDDENVTMIMAQTLIKMKAEKARILN